MEMSSEIYFLFERYQRSSQVVLYTAGVHGMKGERGLLSQCGVPVLSDPTQVY